MPEGSTLRHELAASVFATRIQVDQLRCEVQEAVALTRRTILESHRLIAEADKVLARR
jgi:hypothetical protein